MRVLDLPPSVLLAIFTYTRVVAGNPLVNPRLPNQIRDTPSLGSTGSGPEYATACQAAQFSYNSALSSFNSEHNFVSTTIETLGGTSFTSYTLYENATTLCDGHPRVTYSPAISIGNGTSTYVNPITATTTILGTYGTIFPESSPSCSIKPTDCDPLWVDYSKSLMAASTITPPPAISTPPCVNVSAAISLGSVSSSIYGCGACTIYGSGVELVYFPTTASRDLCTDEPPKNHLTHFGPGALITAYAGTNYSGNRSAYGAKTAAVDGHTFTSGTAYISIAEVSAVDRCSKTYGSPLSNVILAMPSSSVLSLRYSQDHFQQLMETDTVTGYSVNYADFNKPIPWSAWVGQNQCEGSWDTYYCGVIYENDFRPQLAIPPGIRDLSPDFESCQVWYNGLWDPPLALTEYESAAGPTLPSAPTAYSTGAAPSATAAAPTVTATAESQILPSSTGGGAPVNGATLPNAQPTNTCVPSNEPWTGHFVIGGHDYTANGRNKEAVIDGTVTCVSGGPAQILTAGVVATYGNQGLIFDIETTVPIENAPVPATNTVGTVTYTSGSVVETAIQTSEGGPIVVYGPDSTYTITPGAEATTLPNGDHVSAYSEGIVYGSYSTLGVEQSGDTRQTTPTSSNQQPSSTGAESTTTTGGGVSRMTDGVKASLVIGILVAVAIL